MPSMSIIDNNKSFPQRKKFRFFITFYLSTIYLTIYSTNSINHVIGLLTLFPHHNTQNIPFSLYAFSIKITFPTPPSPNHMIQGQTCQQHPYRSSTQRPNRVIRNPLPSITCTRQKIHSWTPNTLARVLWISSQFFSFCTILRCANQAHKTLHISWMRKRKRKNIQRLRRQVHITRTFHPRRRRCYGTIKADYW